MDNHDLFDIEIVSANEPLNTDPFYAWLDANVDRGNPGKNLMMKYLASLGFVVGKHRLTEEQFQILEYVEDVWFQWTPYHTPMSLSECFDDSEPSFYVKGLEGRKGITRELRDAVAEAGWIYDVTPDTTYFEIINGRLYAKYQQILGSRFVCRIKEDAK